MGFLNHAKTAWNGEVRCDWCGQYIKTIEDVGGMGVIGLVGRGIATAKKNYCSKACKLAAQEEKAQKKEDFERRKESGDLTVLEQTKANMQDAIKEPFAEAGKQMKDALSEPMNDMKNQFKNAFGGLFGKK